MGKGFNRSAKGVSKTRLAPVTIFAFLTFASFNALACSMDPPRAAPSYRDLAKTSDLIVVVRIERIRPLSQEDEALMERLLTDPPMNVPFRFPTTSAEFSTLRVLKGKRPEQSLIQNGATNCDVYFLQDKDYVVFAQWPTQSGEIVPAYDTFPLDGSQHSLTALAEVESSLSSPNSAKP